MTTVTKTLLASAATGILLGLAFVSNLINVQNAVWAYVALPIGAIFLGLFLISKLLEKEAALFDQEQKLLHATTPAAESILPLGSEPSCCCSEAGHQKEAA